ncbi:MAG: hypothetical protein SVQ76_01290 [Candidatus Nanohaloarchaea archaeon]|nr:hypothetical protein [Candidatus Nanohaloarchaea archaeon]
MAEPGFQLLFENLRTIGFFQFALPFMLFLAVFYGLLRKTGVIGDDEAVQGVAAISLALITTFGIYVFVPATFLPQFFGALSVLVVLILGLMILAGLAGFDVGGEVDAKSQRYAVVGVVFITLIAFPAVFSMADFDFQISSGYSTFLLTVIMLFGIVYVLRGMGGE